MAEPFEPASIAIAKETRMLSRSQPPWQWGIAIFVALCLSIYIWTLQ